MNLADTRNEAAFRIRLRAWLAEVLPTLPPNPPSADWTERRAYDMAWQRRLFDAGYAGISWPAQYGGLGASPNEELIFLEETERAGAPYVGCAFVGNLHAGPTIAAEATEEQRARYLPSILKGDAVWCQGFSEPEAGSDLASLRTRAVRDGDHYVVTGHKIWTSHAHVADHCELLVRTDPDAQKHAGITWLVMDMDSPGITIQPIETLLRVSDFNEMFLDEVRVPVANRVGEENDGWRVAMVTFSFERGTAFVSELLASMRLVGDLQAIAERTGTWSDGAVRREIGVVKAELDGQWALTKRNVSKAQGGKGVGVGGAIFKLAYHRTRMRLGAVATRVLGRAGLAFGDPTSLSPARLDHIEQRLHALSLSIAAGTEQIQRNIVGERLLGLPKER